MLLLFSLPKHNSSCQLPSELPADLLITRLIWVWPSGIVPPLHPLYDCPYAILCRGPRTFTLQVRQREDIIAVSCLKAWTAVDATPGSTRCHGRPPGPGMMATPPATCPESPAASKRVSFSDLLVSSPLHQEQPRIRPGTVSLLPCGEVFACPTPAALQQPPQRRYPQGQQKPPARIDL
jgi:hypothetical protein